MTHERSLRAFEFFMDAKRTGRSFTLDDLRNATGWSESTVKTYWSKKWRAHLQQDGQRFRVTGFEGFTEADFVALQTQTLH